MGGRPLRIALALAAAAIAAGALVPGAGAGFSADASLGAAISSDGRFVAFATASDEFGGPIETDAVNVYVYDRQTHKIELVSRRSKSAGGAGADENSGSASISANGRFVSFLTEATNLGGPIDPSVANHIYVYDRKLDKLELISRQGKSAGGQGADGNVQASAISDSGRFVAFSTAAGNLGGPTDDASGNNVYVYDRKLDRVQLVSRRSASAGGEGADNSSTGATISANGQVVGFTTAAHNLGGNLDPGAESNSYVYDRDAKRVELVSRRSKSAGGGGADSTTTGLALDASGRFAAFDTEAGNLGARRIQTPTSTSTSTIASSTGSSSSRAGAPPQVDRAPT